MPSLFSRARGRSKTRGADDPSSDGPPATPTKDGVLAASGSRGGPSAMPNGAPDELGRVKTKSDKKRRVRVQSEPSERRAKDALPLPPAPLPPAHHTFGLRPHLPPSPADVRHDSGIQTTGELHQVYTFMPTRFPLTSATSRPRDPRGTTETFRIADPSAGPSTPRKDGADGATRGLGRMGSWVGINKEQERAYGYLNVEPGLTLGLEEVLSAVELVATQLDERGLETPMLFSTKAIDLNGVKIKLLIDSYLKTFANSQPRSRRAFQQSLQFAQPHDLAWFLRWVLSKVSRIVQVEIPPIGMSGGSKEPPVPQIEEVEDRGLLDWDGYETWRGEERAANYDPSFFEAFTKTLPPVLNHLIGKIFSLLSRLSAYSHASGCNPTALSSYFGPLLFGCGRPSCSFDLTHAAYVRSAGATEHLLLSYIRWQAATQDRIKGSIPRSLKDWIKGYPSMIMSDRVMDRGLPRKGVKVLKVERATRVVRAYSRDLLRAGQTWAAEMQRDNGTAWDAWDRVVLETGRPRGLAAQTAQAVDPRLPKTSEASKLSDLPQLTDRHCRRLNLDSPILPASTFASLSSMTAGSSGGLSSTPSLIRTDSRGTGEDWSGVPHTPVGGREKYGSLTDQAWGAFEGSGFDSGKPLAQMLVFDLTEGSKEVGTPRDLLTSLTKPPQAVKAKRNTMAWDDFAAPTGGFDRTNDALSKSLSFSQPVQQQVETWPDERDELRKKLKKAHKETVKFDWNTTPQVVVPGVNNEVMVIEESFVDVWADILLSAGWTEYDELTYREANWVLLDYKALPSDIARRRVSAGDDPRISSLLFCFEEFVPQAYQEQLSAPKAKKGLFFRTRAPKKTSASSTGSGLTMTRSRTKDEVEFDALIRRPTTTKVSLSKAMPGTTLLSPPALGRDTAPARPLPLAGGHSPVASPSTPREAMKKPRLDVTIASPPPAPPKSPRSPSGGGFFKHRNMLGRKTKSHPDLKEVDVDGLETRTISATSSPSSPREGPLSGAPQTPKKKKDPEDQWIGWSRRASAEVRADDDLETQDILVSGGSSRLKSQDAELSLKRTPGGVMGAMPKHRVQPIDTASGLSAPVMDRFGSTSSDIAQQSPAVDLRVPGFSADGRPAPMETLRITERDGPRANVLGEGNFHSHSKDHPSIHSQSALEVLGVSATTERGMSPGFLADGEITPATPGRPGRDSLDSEEERGEVATAPILGRPVAASVPRPAGIQRSATEGGVDVYSTPRAVVHDPMEGAYAAPDEDAQNPLGRAPEDAEHHPGAALPSPALSELEPPPAVTVADIEAIARQPSPARYQHGAPLSFVGEAEEEEEEDGAARGAAQTRAGMLRPSRRALRRG